MDMNGYALEVLARDHLAELRARCERQELARAATPAPGSLRVALGLALIRAGRWTLGDTERQLAPRTS
ncbi:MAG TPA: hypothetical protein VHT71_19150 [Methylomirabilota bacterium]|jgi:hypothetical protein|nr:hypothetical protein [Methylomirabilota bacterium]